jgi:hypothetical protein
MIRFRGIRIDRYRCSIAHGGAEILFSGFHKPSRRFDLACILLLAGPKTKFELFDMIYGDDPDGGPLEYTRVIDVMICQLKKQFTAIGIDVRSDGLHTGRRYFAEPMRIDEAHHLEAAE